jgi:hypothetical protein
MHRIRALLSLVAVVMVGGCRDEPASHVVPITAGKASPTTADDQPAAAPVKRIATH